MTAEPRGRAGRGLRGATLRRASGACALGMAAIAFVSVAGAHPGSASRKAAPVIVRKAVRTSGVYAVTVGVAGPRSVVNEVALQIGALKRTATTNPRHPRRWIRVKVTIAGSSLKVQALGRRARPVITVTLRRVAPSTPAPTPPVTVTTTTTTTTTSATTTTSSAPPPQPPGPGSPYTNLVWSDDFTQDWTGEGGSGNATEAIPSTWGMDNYGGCGNAPGAQESSYPAQNGDAYLTSQGLVIPVVATGPTSYTTAQLDTRGIPGESWLYGTIEASIQLPAGQGLCPAFWLYGDSGTAEIDVLEAPSFVSGSYGPYAPFTVFTLHDTNVQQFEFHTAPGGWNPAQPNVYGLIWTPTSITWTVNYVPYATATAGSLADPSLWSAFTSGKLHLLLDEAVGGWPGDPPANTSFTQPMTVQWVKVFQ